jgi:hypothetical protein
MECLLNLQNSYRECMMKILNDQNISFVDREFYSESANWYTNQDPKSIVDTLLWLSLTDTEKKEKLDLEIDNYFDRSE